MVIMEFRMSGTTQAQPNADNTGAGTHGPTDSRGPSYAQVDHYIDLARRMRADAMAGMARRAYSALFRSGKSGAPAESRHTQQDARRAA